MNEKNPLEMTREALEPVMEKITLADSPVGIDARYTHGVIIAYLKNISDRLDKLEAQPKT